MTKRRLLLVTTSLMLLIGSAATVPAQDSSSSEYLIKAGFIYNFAKLVDWPTSAFPQPDSPIVIGILGADPFGSILDKVFAGKKVNDHGFVIKRIKSASDAKDCHILFVSSSETARISDAIRLTKSMPILTISEIPGFANRGGIINLTLQDSKVRFEVNVDAARAADLNISSRLLALAKIVQQPSGDGRKAE
jgi:YfiR/HmsC-like